MKKLAYAIGPAPSEMTHEELLDKLEQELFRMNAIVDGLIARRATGRGSKKSSKKKSSGGQRTSKKADLEALRRLSERTGIPITELLYGD